MSTTLDYMADVRCFYHMKETQKTMPFNCLQNVMSSYITRMQYKEMYNGLVIFIWKQKIFCDKAPS